MTKADHLELLFEHTISPMCVADNDDVLQLVNPAWSRLLGWPLDALLGRQMYERIHPDDQAATRAAHARLRSGEAVVTFENRYSTATGDWCCLAWTLTASPSNLILGVARDVTAERRLQQHLATAQGSLDALIANAPMGLHLWEAEEDGRLTLVACNAAADRFTGIATSTLIGRPIEEAFPDTLTHDLPARYRAVALAQAGEFHLENLPYNDQRIHGLFDVWVVPVPPRRVAAFFLEVTPSLLAERDLRITLDSIGDGIIVTNDQARIVRINPVAQQLTGWTSGEALGQPLNDIIRLVHLDSGDALPSRIDRVLSEGLVANQVKNAALQRRDGTRVQIADCASPIRLPDGRISGVVLVFRDITQECAMQRQLHHARKMAAIGQLAGGIAHDFNNLLGGIMGGADLLAHQPLDARCQRWVEMITASTSRAAELTQKLLAFGRKTKVQDIAFDVLSTMHQVTAILEHTLDRRINLQVEVPAAPLWTLGDPSQVQSAIFNLCINARDAMPSGGQLRLSVAQTELTTQPACRCCLGTIQPGAYVEISVTDTGSGIAPEIIERIFEPFFTTKGPGQGTGLGLTSVFSTASAHAGAITVDSEVGHGSTFTLYLPLRQAQPAANRQGQLNGGRQHILVVDDEPAIREIVAAVLAARGWEVDTAADHLAAIDVCRRRRPDLVLLDLVMPGMSGAELFTELRRLHPDLRVLLMSGYNLHGAKADGLLASGAIGFLQKPFRSNDLAATVTRALAPAPTAPRRSIGCGSAEVRGYGSGVDTGSSVSPVV